MTCASARTRAAGPNSRFRIHKLSCSFEPTWQAEQTGSARLAGKKSFFRQSCSSCLFQLRLI
jgi:hypothetical protein